MSDSDEPGVHEDYEITVKVPDDATTDSVHAFLRQLADNLDDSDDVYVKHDDAEGLRRDEGGLWAQATMTVYLGCSSKHSGDGPGQDDDDDGDHGDVDVAALS